MILFIIMLLYLVCEAMDAVLDCVDGGHTSCASLTDTLLNSAYEDYASVSIYAPIFSQETNSTQGNASTKVLGFATIGFDWGAELSRLAHDVYTMDIVFSSNTSAHTFVMCDGKVHLKEHLDLHNPNYDSMAVNVPLALIGSFAKSNVFGLEIYPSREYEQSFYTSWPIFTSCGLVGIIMFTSVVFLGYDLLVKEGARENDEILRMKRDFVRFISHEIRTPLNTVSVGMTLLEEGLRSLQLRDVSSEGSKCNEGDKELLSATSNGSVVSCDNSHSVRGVVLYSLPKAKQASLDDMLELTSNVQSSTTTAVEVLNDLLNYDKLENGEVQISKEDVNILEVVGSVYQSFKIQASQKHLKMKLNCSALGCDIDTGEMIVCGDQFKLGHVVRNLMSNALKFTDNYGSITVTLSLKRTASVPTTSDTSEWKPPSDLKSRMCNCLFSNKASVMCSSSVKYNQPDIEYGHIEVGSHENCGHTKRNSEEEKEANTIVIAVKDSGYGLSKDQLERLYQDGVQFDPNKLQAGQGSGLGLYLSYKIMQMHNGTMWADSEGENFGATFFMSLPLQSAVAVPQCIECKQESSEYKNMVELIANIDTPSQRLPGLVLVVDDTASNRKIVCHVLESRGFTCMEAKDGQECIKIVTSNSPPGGVSECDHFCCILMDFEMPVLNGPDASRSLRNLGYGMPIYGLTGNMMQDDVKHFLESGADHVLAKPLKIKAFMDVYNH